jgi:hypothetical protein
MRVAPLAAVAVVALMVSGCLQFIGGSDDDRGGDDGSGSGFDPWPTLTDAVVRPGVGVVSESGSCTSNFVFRSGDNSTLYLGLAAHCLTNSGPGERVTIAGDVQGEVAYDSWYTMDNMEGDAGVSRDTNDFALIEIPNDSRYLVHPAIRHYGGPVGLSDGAQEGQRVLTYGNTPLRQGLEPSNTREGYVVESSQWYTTMYILTPGLPGDSGSAVLDSRGEALGVLIHLGVLPFPASNGAVNLKPALEFAKEHGGVEVELVTWEILDPGVFPDVP